jgi:hypothetical protein
MAQSKIIFTGSSITFKFLGTLGININTIFEDKAIFIKLLHKIQYVIKYLIVEMVHQSIILKGLPYTKKRKAKYYKQSNFIV